MHNPESGNQNTDNQNQNWGQDILPKDNFYQFREKISESPANDLSDEEIKQILIAKKRQEQLQNYPEAKTILNSVSKKLVAAAVSATLIMGMIGFAAHPSKDVLETDHANWQVSEIENVEEVVFHGNIRSNPETTNSQDPTNIYISTDDEVRVKVNGSDKILYYRGENDPNGAWYGIPVDLLEKESYVSSSKARKMEKDRDGYAWVNHNNASVVTEFATTE